MREGEVLAGLLVHCHGGRKLAGQNLVVEAGCEADDLKDVPSLFFAVPRRSLDLREDVLHLRDVPLVLECPLSPTNILLDEAGHLHDALAPVLVDEGLVRVVALAGRDC